MKHHTCREIYCNSRTIKQPRWHGWELTWFSDKMDWQYRKAGIKFIPVPWNLKEAR